MRVAFCLNGLASGFNAKYGGQPVDFKIAFDHYKKHILDKNDCDVFIHTWSVESEKELKEIYKPKKSIFEKQIIFHKPNFLHKLVNNNPELKNNTYSRWYSTKKTIELKKQYEEEHNFKYDCVFVTRFDLAFFSDVIFKDYNMDKFYAAHAGRYFSPEDTPLPNNLYYSTKKKIDMSKYTYKHLGFPYNGEGLSDLWFFSNSENMDKFSTLYDHIDKYLHNGCPLSNHLLPLHHLRELEILHKLEFTLYRFRDFALVRRKFFDRIH